MKLALGRLGILALLALPLVIAASLPADFTAPVVAVTSGGRTGSATVTATVTAGQAAAGRTGTATYSSGVGFPEAVMSSAGPPLDVDGTPGFIDELRDCAPNPFNPATTIHFSLREESVVRLDLYDVRGRRVARLLDEVRGPGDHTLEYRPENIPSGIYLLEMRAGTFRDVRRMALLK